MKSCNKSTCRNCKSPFQLDKQSWCYDTRYRLEKFIDTPENIAGGYTLEFVDELYEETNEK